MAKDHHAPLAPKAQDKQYLTIPLPTRLSANKILIIALIAASFLLGNLYNKVQVLEKKASAPPVPSAAQGTSPSQPAVTQPPAGPVKPVSASDHIKGNPNAKLTIIEYSDYECPFCKRFHPTSLELMKQYGDKIRWVFRHYPLSFHQNAQKEAEASECIAELGGNDAFWQFTDKIFERTTSNGTGFALDQLGPLASELGVDQTQFQTCLDSGKYAKRVQQDIAEGSSAGVTGTPATFVIDSKGKSQLVTGAQPIEAFKTIIDQALSK